RGPCAAARGARRQRTARRRRPGQAAWPCRCPSCFPLFPIIERRRTAGKPVRPCPRIVMAVADALRTATEALTSRHVLPALARAFRRHPGTPHRPVLAARGAGDLRG